MRAARTILVLLISAALSLLPVGGAVASVMKSGSALIAQSVQDCHGHDRQNGNKPAEKAACVFACASMSWANTVAPVPDQVLGRLEGTMRPPLSEGTTLPHIGSPPFRPPRV